MNLELDNHILNSLKEAYGYPPWYGTESYVWPMPGNTVLKLSMMYDDTLAVHQAFLGKMDIPVAPILELEVVQRAINGRMSVLVLQRRMLCKEQLPAYVQPGGVCFVHPPEEFSVDGIIYEQRDNHAGNHIGGKWIDIGSVYRQKA